MNFEMPELPQTTLVKVGIGIAAVVLAVGLFFAWLHSQRQDAVDDHIAEVAASSAAARDTAGEQAVADAAKNANNEQDLHHAIDTAPSGGSIHPATHAVSCERLRKLGRIPESCRPAGSDGSQAGPR